MNRERIIAYLRRDGWLLAAIALCAAICMMMSLVSRSDSPGDDRISRVLSSVAGAGRVEAAISYEEDAACGAIIVADGAADIGVQLRLTNAVAALLGIAPERIAVYPREGGK